MSSHPSFFRIAVSILWILGSVAGGWAAPQTPDLGEDADRDGVSNHEDILAGAEDAVKVGARYLTEKGWLPTDYRDGVKQAGPVYPMGDVAPDVGVCTDVVIRSLRRAGFDLQELVHQDILANPEAYGAKKENGTVDTDANIDHRRVRTLKTFFDNHADVLTKSAKDEDLAEWRPGDIVAWETGPNTYHMGIISRRKSEGRAPLVIHCHDKIGYTAETDHLRAWPIIGHYRFPSVQKGPGQGAETSPAAMSGVAEQAATESPTPLAPTATATRTATVTATKTAAPILATATPSLSLTPLRPKAAPVSAGHARAGQIRNGYPEQPDPMTPGMDWKGVAVGGAGVAALLAALWHLRSRPKVRPNPWARPRPAGPLGPPWGKSVDTHVDTKAILGEQEGSEKIDSHLSSKRYAEAEQACREILSMDLSLEDQLAMQCRLALALEGQNRIEEAYRHFYEIGKRDPEEPLRSFCLIHQVNTWSRREEARRDIGPILEALQDHEANVRWRAARALGKAATREAMAPLCDALADSEEKVRSHAAAALGQLGDPAASQSLMDALKDRSPEVRGWAAKALGELGDPATVKEILPLLEDPKAWVKWYACWALGKLGGPDVVGPLLSVMESDDDKVREVAATSLGGIKDRSVVPALIQLLDVCLGEAAQALGMIGDPVAEPALRDHLRAINVGDRCRVIHAMGELRCSDSVPSLRRIIEDGSYREIGYAAEALAKIGDASCVSSLAKLFKRMEMDVSSEYDKFLLGKVAKALHSFDVPEARRAIQDAMVSKNASIRQVMMTLVRSRSGLKD